MTQRILNAIPSTEIEYEEQAPLDRVEPVPPGRYVLGGIPPVSDQGTDGTCVAHAVGNVVAWHHKRKHGSFPLIDYRAFYTLTRRAVGVEPDPTFTQGLSLLWALRTAKGSGVPLVGGGRTPRITGFSFVGSAFDDCQRALWQLATPVALRVDWDANWFYLPTSKVMKQPVGQVVGGHAVYAYGYDDDTLGAGLECAIERNSWGAAWRTMYHPDAYLDAAALEGWIVTGIE